jgi:DnaJ-class molecular chaperone
MIDKLSDLKAASAPKTQVQFTSEELLDRMTTQTWYNPYDVLDCDCDATEEELKKIYRGVRNQPPFS